MDYQENSMQSQTVIFGLGSSTLELSEDSGPSPSAHCGHGGQIMGSIPICFFRDNHEQNENKFARFEYILLPSKHFPQRCRAQPQKFTQLSIKAGVPRAPIVGSLGWKESCTE
jgi:hypothetical protein